MIVISDTSPIHYLILIERQNILHSLYGQIVIPETVSNELQAATAPVKVREWISNCPSWLHTVPFTIRPDNALSHLDEGEIAAIQLAEARQANFLIIDEKAGRAEALKRNIPVVGTLGILEKYAERGELDLPIVLAELKANKFFISPALEINFLERDAQRKAHNRSWQDR